MPFQLSPGVAVVEKDFSSIVPAVSSSAGAFAGPFSWGPIEDPVRVSSETDLVTRFGKPTDSNFQSFFTAANFLAYTNSMYVSRSDAAALRNAVAITSGSITSNNIIVTSGGVGYSSIPVVTFSAPEVAGGVRATGTAQTTATTIGGTTTYTVVGITLTNPGSGYLAAPTISFSTQAGATSAIATVTQVTLGGVKIKNVSDYLSGFNSGAGTFGPWAAKFAGIKGNGLRVVMLDSGAWASGSTPTTIKQLFTGAPGTSSYASTRTGGGLEDDEVHIVIFDNDQGEFSGVAGSVLEKYSFLSKLSDARRSDGSNNYYKSVVNSQSRYIWWLDHETTVSSSPVSSVIGLGDTVSFTAASGTPLLSTITITTTSDNFAALSAYKAYHDAAVDKNTQKISITGAGVNNGVYDVANVSYTTSGPGASIAQFTIKVNSVSIVTTPGATTVVATAVAKHAWGQSSENISKTLTKKMVVLSAMSDYSLSGGTVDYNSSDSNIQNAFAIFANADQYDISLIPVGNVSPVTAKFIVDNIAEVRKDCVVFISPNSNYDPILSNGSAATNSIIEYKNATNINSSYAFIDSGFKYQYDRYNDAYRWVPMNGDIAGLCARTDYSADPWFSPGGFNRGQIKNIVKLAFNPSQSDRDVLYTNGVNPVVTFPGQGTILYGDKTMLSRPSAFDRINVRRLFIVVEKAIAVAAKFQMFEFNDGFTRAQFKNLVEPFLRDVQGRRGIVDFRVKCDEANNNGEIIDRNEFVADIFIKPNRSINFITLNFVAARSSVSFEEIGA